MGNLWIGAFPRTEATQGRFVRLVRKIVRARRASGYAGCALECGGSTPLSFFGRGHSHERKDQSGVQPPHSKVRLSLLLASRFNLLLQGAHLVVDVTKLR